MTGTFEIFKRKKRAAAFRVDRYRYILGKKNLTVHEAI
jgi:hypothetical protein